MEDSNPLESELAFQWEDCLPLFREVAATLHDADPMLAAPQFSLFEAMSAGELLDPKMDPCYGLKPPYKLEEIVCSHVPTQLSLLQTENLLLSLLIREVQFFDGASLLETINQCCFVWPQAWSAIQEKIDKNESKLEFSAALLYVKSLIGSSDLVISSVLTADIFEDEDFQVTSTVTSKDCALGAAAEIENWIKENSSSNEHKNLKNLILLRLTLFNLLKKVKDSADCGMKRDGSDLLKEMDSHIVEVVQLSQDLVKIIKEIRSSELVNRNVNEVANEFYDSKIIRTVQANPLRSVVLRSLTEALNYLDHIASELTAFGKVIRSCIVDMSTMSYDFMLEWLCRSSSQKSSIVVRSFIWCSLHLLFPYMHVLIFNSFKARGLPEEIGKSAIVDQWVNTLCPKLWEIAKIFVISRNRIISRFTTVLEKWNTILKEAAFCDRTFDRRFTLSDERTEKEGWLFSWAIVHTTWFMDFYFTLVVEMDLLSLSERDYFYWYWDFIIATRASMFKRLRELRYIADRVAYDKIQEEAKQSKDNGKKSKNKALKEAKRILPPTVPEASLEESILLARGMLAKGLFRLLSGYVKLGLLNRSECQYTTWDLLFANRFRSFHCIESLQVLTYTDFNTTQTTGLKDTQLLDVLKMAAHCFKNVKPFIDNAKAIYQDSIERGKKSDFNCDEFYMSPVTEYLKTSVALSLCCTRRMQEVEEFLNNNPGQPEGSSYLEKQIRFDRTHSKIFLIPDIVSKAT